MRRAHLGATAVAALSLLLTTSAAARPPDAAQAARVAKVQLRHTKVGTILVSSSGFTLYEFTRDRGSQNSCVRISGCSELWPALQTSAHPLAGPGVHASQLSSINLSGGVKQVTYAGHPLYLYSGDTGPGETAYVGARAFGGNWDAVGASGQAVR